MYKDEIIKEVMEIRKELEIIWGQSFKEIHKNVRILDEKYSKTYKVYQRKVGSLKVINHNNT